jgi:hypothetical protein
MASPNRSELQNREFVHVFTRIRLIISIVLVERTAIWSAAIWPVFVFVVSPARRCCENKRVLQLASPSKFNMNSGEFPGIPRFRQNLNVLLSFNAIL